MVTWFTAPRHNLTLGHQSSLASPMTGLLVSWNTSVARHADVIAERVMTEPLVTTPDRSSLMRRVKQQGTAAEMAVRRLLYSTGARYRVNVRSLPGSPDIANAGRRRALFVHGCFWHGHTGCRRATVPKRNREFWRKKFAANHARDLRTVAALEARGYKTLTVWECELKDLEALKSKLMCFWFDNDIVRLNCG